MQKEKTILVIILIMVISTLHSCSDYKNLDYSKITNIDLSINGGMEQSFRFKFDKSKMEANIVHFLNGDNRSKIENWTEEKFNNFICDLEKCNIEKWTGDYIVEDSHDMFEWRLQLKNDKETIIEIKGVGKHPNFFDWNRYIDVLSEYVNPAIAQY